jgi:hypothetical protein
MARLEPQTLSFIDTAPYVIAASVDCAATPEQVFATWEDHRGWASWVGWHTTSMEPTSDPPSGVGATRTVTFLWTGKVHEQFIGWEPPNLFAFTGVGARPKVFAKLVERATVEATGEHRSRITYTMAFDFPPILRRLGPWFTKVLKGELDRAIVRMGREVEHRAAAATT